jgi:hypothetical protein
MHFPTNIFIIIYKYQFRIHVNGNKFFKDDYIFCKKMMRDEIVKVVIVSEKRVKCWEVPLADANNDLQISDIWH